MPSPLLRVRLGQRSDGTQGLWVSAPGKSADSTTFEDLLVDTTRVNMRPVINVQYTSANLPFDSARSTNPVLLSIDNSVSPPRYIWANGIAAFSTAYTHGLGFLPVAHMSVQAASPGIFLPHLFIDSTNITLIYERAWTTNGAAGPVTQPSSLTFNCTFTFTLFRQPMP